MKNTTEIRAEYCLNNGISIFNDNMLNDYTAYLEERLIEEKNKKPDCCFKRAICEGLKAGGHVFLSYHEKLRLKDVKNTHYDRIFY